MEINQALGCHQKSVCASSFRGGKKASMWRCFLDCDPAVYGARARFFGTEKTEDLTLFVP